MEDRSEGGKRKRLAALRTKILLTDPGLWLSSEQVELLTQDCDEMLRTLDELGAADDRQAIEAVCEVSKARIRTIIGEGGYRHSKGHKRIIIQSSSDLDEYVD